MELGKITVQNLGFESILGALPFERQKPQPIQLHFSLWLDFKSVATNDALDDTVDYAELAEKVKSFIQKSKFQLIETLVFRTAKFLLAQAPRIQAAWVHVEKPEALPGKAISAAEIKLERD